MVAPWAGCGICSQGAHSAATTQAGLSHEAMAANINAASAAYSSAKKSVTCASCAETSGLK